MATGRASTSTISVTRSRCPTTGPGPVVGIGNALANEITGNQVGNDLQGRGGNDSIFGQGGSDVISGGAGFDFLTGGGAQDRFVFDAAGTTAAPERDAITDFSFAQGDKIDLRAYDAQLVNVSQITVVNEGAVSGLGSNVKTIYVDLQNDGAANNTTKSEIVIYTQAGAGGFLRNYIVSEGDDPFADILI